jgi:2-polyprenyl-3-methyl-5-hydroxy-6-metoxy-1,4-benzoquinol methylase
MPPESRASDRFAFGDNWRAFVELVDETRIGAAADSLAGALKTVDLSGRTFLDVGCGSGLFSLAARRLGANVRSFDADPDSVAAALELRRRFGVDDGWIIEQGSVLDERFVHDLGGFDIVYAWGVLHHTGDLWGAMDTTFRLVAPGGLLYVSVYNDQGFESRMWEYLKCRYNRSGRLTRCLIIAGGAAYIWRRWPLRKLMRLVRREHDVRSRPSRARGMSLKHDLVDWIGGYPFEVARPEQVFDFAQRRGCDLRHLKTCGGGFGCNEYVFERPSLSADPAHLRSSNSR